MIFKCILFWFWNGDQCKVKKFPVQVAVHNWQEFIIVGGVLLADSDTRGISRYLSTTKGTLISLCIIGVNWYSLIVEPFAKMYKYDYTYIQIYEQIVYKDIFWLQNSHCEYYKIRPYVIRKSIPEYAKFFWHLSNTLSGKQADLRRLFLLFARNFHMSSHERALRWTCPACPVNFTYTAILNISDPRIWVIN